MRPDPRRNGQSQAAVAAAPLAPDNAAAGVLFDETATYEVRAGRGGGCGWKLESVISDTCTQLALAGETLSAARSPPTARRR